MKKRIIPCLDIREGRTVKGVNFVDIKDAGDPIELAKTYESEGADELVLLDISATVENRKTMIKLVEDISKKINIPFTVGGGISTVDDAKRVLKAGASKVSINSAAVSNPNLISEISNMCGKEKLVIAIDTKQTDDGWIVVTHGGNSATNLNALDWAKKCEELGAGEILLTSMKNDGVKNGFALEITSQISNAVNIPVIASGGAGTKQHFIDLFTQTKANAGLAASVFHFGEILISDLKEYLRTNKVDI